MIQRAQSLREKGQFSSRFGITPLSWLVSQCQRALPRFPTPEAFSLHSPNWAPNANGVV